MQIDMNTPLTVFGGEEIKLPDGKPLTLGEACKNALGRVAQDHRPDGAEMIRRYSLGCAIADAMRGNRAITLSSKDNAWLQELLTSGYRDAPIVAGQASILLDPPEKDNSPESPSTD